MPLSERQKKILSWARFLVALAFFIGMILQIRQLMMECPLCAYEITNQYGNLIPREEQIRMMKSCLETYNQKQENFVFNFTLNTT